MCNRKLFGIVSSSKLVPLCVALLADEADVTWNIAKTSARIVIVVGLDAVEIELSSMSDKDATN